MKRLTIADFALDLTHMTNSIDFQSLRNIPELPVYTSLNNDYLFSLKLILLFYTKWQLAFKRFNLKDELNYMNKNTRILLHDAMRRFTEKLEQSEKEYYAKAFANTPAITTYKLTASYNWPNRFYYIFKIDPWKETALSRIIRNFIELLIFVSKETSFTP